MNDILGSLVHKCWEEWVLYTGATTTGITPTWEEFPEDIKMCYREIGQKVANFALKPLNDKRCDLIEKKYRGGGLTDKENVTLEILQEVYFDCIHNCYPLPELPPEAQEILEKK